MAVIHDEMGLIDAPVIGFDKGHVDHKASVHADKGNGRQHQLNMLKRFGIQVLSMAGVDLGVISLRLQIHDIPVTEAIKTFQRGKHQFAGE